MNFFFNHSIDMCLLPSDRGPCKANLKRYFYNTTSKDCESFVYGGCPGNKNNFQNKIECENQCKGVGNSFFFKLYTFNRKGLIRSNRQPSRLALQLLSFSVSIPESSEITLRFSSVLVFFSIVKAKGNKSLILSNDIRPLQKRYNANGAIFIVL